MIFCMKINNIFYKLVVSVLLVIARHAESTQNNKFAKSLQYLKNKVRDELVQMNIKVFYKLILSYFIDVIRHA